VRYKGYMLAVLLVILACNYLDRSVLALSLQNIKADLALSDTQLGFLSGIAFALFYSMVGLPIARWADRGNRVTIISVTTLMWSVMVALCGAAATFRQLLFIRIGVAVGESGCIPPALSLIASEFERAERPRAVATYMLGGPISIVIGYFLAGWLNQFYGWRATFALMGIPGVGLAVLAWLTLREPRRDRRNEPAGPRALRPLLRSEPPLLVSSKLRAIWPTLWRNRTFCHLLLCAAVLGFFTQGIWLWLPAYFIRTFGMASGELGTWLAISVGVPGVVGTILGGELASRMGAGREDVQLKAVAVAFACFGLLLTGVYLTSNRYLAFVLWALGNFAGSTASGPLFAAVQTAVPHHMRAIAIAIIYLFVNLIGTGLGPLAAGALSDLLRSWVGSESLQYALLLLCPGYLWGAWHAWRASVSVLRDLDAVRGDAVANDATAGHAIS
jgi:MFS family permease